MPQALFLSRRTQNNKMSTPSKQPEIVLFDDEEEETPKKPPSRKSQQIIVFDDEDCLEEDPSEGLNDSNMESGCARRGMSSEQYRDICSKLQDRIILSNLSNLKQVKRPEANYFKEAKEKRKSNEIIFDRRKSRNIQELIFEPKKIDVKVNFGSAQARQNNFVGQRTPSKDIAASLDLSMNEELVDSVMGDEDKEKRPSLSGAFIEKKSALKVQEDKQKNLLKVSNFREFLYTQLRPDYSIFLRLKRTENGFINATYKVYFQENNKFIMACQKQGFSKYVFSTSEVHISEDHISYLGKLEASFFGNEFTMFDAGEEYYKTKIMENYKKQLAFIEYTQVEDFPRTIETYLTTCDNKNTDFTVLDKNQNVIQKKWLSSHRRNLCRMASKAPSFDPQECNYKLDFRGMAGVPSVKNFIIENEEHPDALIFGRQQDKDSYLLRIKAPFSIMQAVGIAMSSIHHKFL